MFAWADADGGTAHPGAQLALAHWFGPLALVLEGNAQDYRFNGSMLGIGAGARLEVARLPSLGGSQMGLFAEGGVGRERWQLDAPFEGSATLGRRVAHAGIGFNLAYPGERGHFGAVVWLRGKLGEELEGPGASKAMPGVRTPGRGALVFGAGFLSGW